MAHVKQSNYFSHDYNARHDLKIKAMVSDLGIAGYGVFWTIIEIMAEDSTHKIPHKGYAYTAIADDCKMSLEETQETIKKMITDYELFESDEKYFWSESLLRRAQMREDITNKRKEAGRKGGIKTASYKQSLSTAQAKVKQSSSGAKAIKVKESKVKESKVKESKTITPLPPEGEAIIAPIHEGMTFFRCSEHELKLTRKWYQQNNLSTDLIPKAIEQVDDWLRGETSKAKKARNQKTHFLRLRAPWVIENLSRVCNATKSKETFRERQHRLDKEALREGLEDIEAMEKGNEQNRSRTAIDLQQSCLSKF